MKGKLISSVFGKVFLMVFLFVFMLEDTCKAITMEAVEVETVKEATFDTMVSTGATGEKLELPEGAGETSLVTKQFNVHIEYGLNGIVKYGASMPISVRVANLADDFEGTLRIIIKNYSSNQGNVAYDNDLIIASGASKTFEITTDCISYSTLTIGVEILDIKGNVLLSNSIDVASGYYDYAFIGVLSDDFTALNYFDGVEIQSDYGSYYSSSIIELEADDISDTAAALSCLNYLIINSFDTSSLSDTQYKAIQEWVSMGGLLIVGTGPDYSTTLAMFDDEFLQGNINETVIGDMEVIPAIDKGFDGVISFKKEHSVYSILVDGASQMNTSNISYADELSLIQKKEIGKGAVIVTGFNLGLDPIDSLTWNDYFGKALLNDATTSFSTEIFDIGIKGSISSVNYELYNLLDMLFNVKVPNIALYAIFFVIYVLFAGPIGYLILKTFDKREWIWGLVPISAVVFTIFLAVLSIPSRITEPMVSHFTVFHVQENVVSEQIYTALQTPDTKEYAVQFQSDYKNFSPLRISYSGIGSTNDNSWDYRVKNTTDGYQIITNHNTTFTTDYMVFEKVNTDSTCSFNTQLEGTTAYFSGSVTNNTGYDMVDAFICYGSYAVYLGNFAKGETKTFNTSENINMYGFYSWNLYDYFESSSSQKYKIESAYSYMCALYNNALAYNQGVVMGYIPEYECDMVADDTIEESGAALIYQEFLLQPSDIKGSYIEDLFAYVVNPNYDELDYSDHMMYANIVDVEFSIPMTSISKVFKTAPNEWGVWYEDVLVYAYNYETDTYDQWFNDDSNEMEFIDSCPYVDKNGTLQLRFECSEIYDEYAPGIALIGE